MHAHDGVEVGLWHVPHGRVTHDAGVVDQDVELAERVDRLLDELGGLLVVGDVTEVGDGGAALLLDQRDGLVSRPACSLSADRTAEVVDDHLGALAGQLQRVPAANPVSCTSNDGDLAVEQTHPFQPTFTKKTPAEQQRKTIKFFILFTMSTLAEWPLQLPQPGFDSVS